MRGRIRLAEQIEQPASDRTDLLRDPAESGADGVQRLAQRPQLGRHARPEPGTERDNLVPPAPDGIERGADGQQTADNPPDRRGRERGRQSAPGRPQGAKQARQGSASRYKLEHAGSGRAERRAKLDDGDSQRRQFQADKDQPQVLPAADELGELLGAGDQRLAQLPYFADHPADPAADFLGVAFQRAILGPGVELPEHFAQAAFHIGEHAGVHHHIGEPGPLVADVGNHTAPGSGQLFHLPGVLLVEDRFERRLDRRAVIRVDRSRLLFAGPVGVFVGDFSAGLRRAHAKFLEALVLAGYGISDRLDRLHHILAHRGGRIAQGGEQAVGRIQAVCPKFHEGLGDGIQVVRRFRRERGDPIHRGIAF